jgi:hypothetical protein
LLEILSIITGAMLTVISIMAAGNLMAPNTPLPVAVRYCTGAAICSQIVFLLLACHAGYWPVYAALSIGLTVLARFAHPPVAAADPRLPRMPLFFRMVMIVFGVCYLINALAPEIQADATGYHLRLVSDYVRHHTFTAKSGFYDVLPQGMEMLFVPAFAIGGGSAAKLLHFTFLIAAIPLIRELAREAGLNNSGACAAAAIFFLAPVCAVDGTAAYTDLGLVCACCSVLILLIRWNRRRIPILMVCAAINAAFCYAVKPTFGWVALVSVVFVAVRERRARTTLAMAGVVLACVAPWLIRAWILTGSFVSPFFSQWIPNSVLTPELERHLSGQYSAFRPSFNGSHAWLGYTLFGDNQGTFGPAFLLVPVAVLALAKPRRRWLVVCSALLAMPFVFNTGARFLMPAMSLAAIAIASILPRGFALAVVAVQAVAVFPPILNLYANPGNWRLEGLPLAAAFRIEPEEAYLRRSVSGFGATKMIADNTPPGARILAFLPLAEAYIPRDVLTWWHSRRAQKFTDALQFAMMSQGTRARLVSWRWPENQYQALRMTALSDLRVVSAALPHSNAGLNSWQMHKPGETIGLYAPGGAAGADFLIWPGDQAIERTEALSSSGRWQPPDGAVERTPRYIDVRKDATAYIRRSGYDYIVVRVVDDAFEKLGVDMVRHPDDWGVTIAGEAKGTYLLHIRASLF